VFSLARYDLNYDVRDRARMVTALLAGLAPSRSTNGGEEDVQGERRGVVLRREQVKLVLFEGKERVVDIERNIGGCLPNRNLIRQAYEKFFPHRRRKCSVWFARRHHWEANAREMGLA